MVKRINELNPGDSFVLPMELAGFNDEICLIPLRMTARKDGDIQIVSNLIAPELLNNIEVYVYDNKEDDNDSDRT